jgi:hypothetical protein
MTKREKRRKKMETEGNVGAFQILTRRPSRTLPIFLLLFTQLCQYCLVSGMVLFFIERERERDIVAALDQRIYYGREAAGRAQ